MTNAPIRWIAEKGDKFFEFILHFFFQYPGSTKTNLIFFISDTTWRMPLAVSSDWTKMVNKGIFVKTYPILWLHPPMNNVQLKANSFSLFEL